MPKSRKQRLLKSNQLNIVLTVKQTCSRVIEILIESRHYFLMFFASKVQLSHSTPFTNSMGRDYEQWLK